MNCKHYASLLHEFVDHTLPQEILDDINAHLETCERCKVFFKTYSLTITLSRQAESTCCVTPEQIDRLKTLLINRLLDK